MFGQRVPTRGAKPQPEPASGLGVEIAFRQVIARCRGFLGFQSAGIEFLRGRVRRDQPAPAATIALHTGAAAAVGDGVLIRSARVSTASTKLMCSIFWKERVDVATLAAAEAVKVAVVGTHMERRRFLVVERAQALQRVRTGPSELNVIAHHVLDPHLLADGGDVTVGYAAFSVAVPAPKHPSPGQSRAGAFRRDALEPSLG